MGFFSSFFGSDQRRDLKRADAQAKGYLDEGERRGLEAYDEGYGRARGDLDPYIESGRRGQDFYDDLLGLNGPEARARAQAVVSSDPQFTGELGESQNAMLRNLTATGRSQSGAALLAGQRVLNQTYGNVMARYRDRGAQGFAAAGQGANLAYGHGSDQAGLIYGHAQQQAGRAQSYGNAMAASRNTGINNFLNLAGTAARAYTGYAQPGR